MAPVEFEKKIKESFEERRIEPSKEAWDKIGEQLEITQGRKVFWPWHYGMAAAVSLILVASWWIYQGDGAEEKLGPAVNRPIQTGPSDRALSTSEFEMESNTHSADKTISRDPIRTAKREEADESMGDPVQEGIRPDQDALLAENEQLMDEKIWEVVAQVENMETSRQSVTDKEIDSLLRAAQQSLLQDRVFRKEEKVDAQLLLAGVEDELEDSFREKVFEKLKQGFDKVRSAVAQRNN